MTSQYMGVATRPSILSRWYRPISPWGSRTAQEYGDVQPPAGVPNYQARRVGKTDGFFILQPVEMKAIPSLKLTACT